jgi:hypothetical protein
MNLTEVESGGDKGGTSNGATPSPQKTRLTLSDGLFLVFLCLVIQAVFMVGRIAHDEATKTEVSKANGEAWVKWFAENSPSRFEAGFKPVACAGLAPLQSEMLDGKPEAEGGGGNIAVENKVVENKAKGSKKTWGGCMDALKSAKVSVAEQINPFSLKPAAFVAKCDPANHSLNGAIVLEKLTPTPPGSSVPSTASELLVSDGIASKLQLRVTICDKGSYPIRIAEFEF